MKQLTFVAHSLADTDRLGAALAELLPDGTTVALCGTLGAGKTRLVQAVAAQCGVPRQEVVSPTFVLCQEYHGTRLLYHLDAYRLQGDDEFRQLGPEEYFHSSALVFVEWADRVADALPADRIEIRITPGDQNTRQFEILAHGDEYARVLDALETRLNVSP